MASESSSGLSFSSSEPLGVAELAGLLLATPSMERFLAELLALAVSTLEPVGSAGITLRPEGRLRTVVSSDEVATRADQVQYETGTGPCLAAFEQGVPVYVPDLAAEGGRFGGSTPAVLALGVRSVFAVPLEGPGGQVVGALNLYGSRAGAYGEAVRERARVFAARASAAVTVALQMADRARLNEDLRAALDSRAVINQAVGIIMAQQRCGAEEAFAVLRQASQNRNVRLRQVAAEIVAAVSGEPFRGARFRP